jgi:hypothetical protein
MQLIETSKCSSVTIFRIALQLQDCLLGATSHRLQASPAENSNHGSRINFAYSIFSNTQAFRRLCG